MEFSYHGGFKLEIDLQITLPFTSTTIAVAIEVTILSFGGKAMIHVLPPPSKRFWIGFHKYVTLILKSSNVE